jgi:diguanylate cyclase (GGDEF)-like protein
MPSNAKLIEVIRLQTDIAKLGLDLANVMNLVVERTLPLLEADGAAIELAEGDEIVYRSTSGIARPYLGLRLKLDSSLSGLSIRCGTMLKCDDSETDDRVDKEACQKVGLRSMIVMPLSHNGQPIGVLKAMSVQPAIFTDADMQLLGLLSEVISASMFYATQYDLSDLFYKATHDAMTGLANRSLFMDRARQLITQYARDHLPIGIAIIDMDGLKQINDTYGHRAGDVAIVELAHRINAASRATDTVARLGGDEFGVIVFPIDSSEGVQALAQRMSSEINRHFHFNGFTLELKASIGTSYFPEDSLDINKLIEAADHRMYAMKRRQHHVPVSSD